MPAKGHYCHQFNRCRFHSLDSSTTFEKVFMTDRSPLDDSLVTFDQHPSSSSSVTTPTKSKANDLYDNRSMDDVDQFASHHHGNGNGTNGQDYHSNNGTNKDDHHHGTNGSNDGGSKQFSLNNEHENGNSILFKSASRQILIVLFQFRPILRIITSIRHVKTKNQKIHRGITVPMSMVV